MYLVSWSRQISKPPRAHCLPWNLQLWREIRTGFLLAGGALCMVSPGHRICGHGSSAGPGLLSVPGYSSGSGFPHQRQGAPSLYSPSRIQFLQPPGARVLRVALKIWFQIDKSVWVESNRIWHSVSCKTFVSAIPVLVDNEGNDLP